MAVARPSAVTIHHGTDDRNKIERIDDSNGRVRKTLRRSCWLRPLAPTMRLSTNYRSNQRYIRDTLEPPCIHAHTYTRTRTRHVPDPYGRSCVVAYIYVLHVYAGLYIHVYIQIDRLLAMDRYVRAQPTLVCSLARSRLYGKGCCCLRCSKGWKGGGGAYWISTDFFILLSCFSTLFSRYFFLFEKLQTRPRIRSLPGMILCTRQTRFVSIIIFRKKLHPMEITII